jgi:hypothetical protein
VELIFYFFRGTINIIFTVFFLSSVGARPKSNPRLRRKKPLYLLATNEMDG